MSLIPGIVERSGLALFPSKTHLWTMGIPLCIGTCLVSYYFAHAGLGYVAPSTRILCGLMGVSIFAYMSAWLAGVTFWRDPLSRLGFTLYWAAAAGLGGGYVLGLVYGLGVGSIFFVALYVMEHLLKRSGFIGGIFDGVYSGFSIAFSFIVASMVLSLIVYQKLMHPLALAGVSIFIIGVRVLAKRYYRITDQKRKHRMAQTLGYRRTFQVAQSSVFMGLVVLLFLDVTYFVHGVLFSALFYVLEFMPGVREPIEMERPHSDMDIID